MTRPVEPDKGSPRDEDITLDGVVGDVVEGDPSGPWPGLEAVGGEKSAEQAPQEKKPATEEPETAEGAAPSADEIAHWQRDSEKMTLMTRQLTEAESERDQLRTRDAQWQAYYAQQPQNTQQARGSEDEAAFSGDDENLAPQMQTMLRKMATVEQRQRILEDDLMRRNQEVELDRFRATHPDLKDTDVAEVIRHERRLAAKFNLPYLPFDMAYDAMTKETREADIRKRVEKEIIAKRKSGQAQKPETGEGKVVAPPLSMDGKSLDEVASILAGEEQVL